MSRLLLPALLVFFLVGQYFDSRGLRRLCLVLTGLALGLSAALGWVAWRHPGQVTGEWVKSLGSPVVVVPNDVALVAIILPFSLALLLVNASRVVKVVAGLSIVSGVCAMALLHSRVALLAEAAAALSMAAAWRPRSALWMGGAMLALALGADAWLGFPLLAKHGFVADSRLPLWLAAWRMFLDAPWLGHGPHTFLLFYQAYLHSADTPAWMLADRWRLADHRTTPWPHNLYLELLAEQGVIGLAGLVALLLAVASAARRRLGAARGEGRVLAAAVCASLNGYCVAAAFELTFLRQWVVLVLFLLAGIGFFLSQCEENKDEIKQG